ncbi:DUF1129 domain-containing protein [Limosilactobacillus caecicola]|uniref:DUF1129 domain-containing protein n=1 Tax=Limosilactobacillus caecicola TaxID=2941332 RepID=UPI0038996AAE
MSEQPRNAAAGQRQKQYIKETNKEAGKAFSEYGLTRKNEEFVYQLNKQLEAKGVTADKKATFIDQTINDLLAGQKKGQTAKAQFGTPTAYADELINPKKKTSEVPENSNFWLLALDNGMMFFAIFAFMFGLIAFMNPNSLSPNGHYGSSGLTAILIIAIAGGLLFGYVAKIMAPYKDKKTGKVVQRNLWLRIGLIVLAFLIWIGIYTLTALLPNAVNPQTNKWVYIILGIVVFGADLFLRTRFNITNNVFGGAPRNRK